MVVLLTRFIWYYSFDQMKVVFFSQGAVATFYRCGG